MHFSLTMIRKLSCSWWALMVPVFWTFTLMSAQSVNRMYLLSVGNTSISMHMDLDLPVSFFCGMRVVDGFDPFTARIREAVVAVEGCKPFLTIGCWCWTGEMIFLWGKLVFLMFFLMVHCMWVKELQPDCCLHFLMYLLRMDRSLLTWKAHQKLLLKDSQLWT